MLMTVVFIILGCLLAAGVPLYIMELNHQKKEEPESGESEPDNEPKESQECCGIHLNCEKTSLVATSVEAPVYYEDEDLDRFAGREADSYDNEEVEQFRDILLTLLPEDVAGWARSLQQRRISLPPDVRDELLMIVNEQRQLRGESIIS